MNVANRQDRNLQGQLATSSPQHEAIAQCWQRLLPCAIVGWALGMAGCGGETGPAPPSTSMDAMAAQLDAANEAKRQDATAEQPSEPPVRQASQQASSEQPQVITAKTPKKGKSLHDQGSYLSAVGSARFRTEHQMIINQYKHALNLYQAEHGEYPQSHEEFMTKIIEFNSISLPELEAGYEYWYDASDHELKQRPIGSED